MTGIKRSVVFLYLMASLFSGWTLNASSNSTSHDVPGIVSELVKGNPNNDVSEEIVLHSNVEKLDASNITDEDNIDDFAVMIDIEDEVSLEDEALVLAHIDSDIEDFEDLRKTIAYLEQNIRKHADTHVVKSQELVEADKVLKELDVKVVNSYEQELKALKSQISKLDQKYDNSTIQEITKIVENAEMFLQLSMDKIEEIEMIDHEWEAAEKSANIQNMITQDEVKEYGSKIILQALKPSFDDKSVENNTYNSNNSTELNQKIRLESSMFGKIMKINMRKKENETKVIVTDLNSKTDQEIQATSFNKDLDSDISEDSDEGEVLEDIDEGENLEDADEGEVLEEKNVDHTGKEVPEKTKIGQKTSNLELEMTEERIKDKSNEESANKHRTSKGHDAVEHYSTKVKEALNSAKEMSHQYIDEKLRHHNDISSDSEDHLTGSVSYLYIIIIALILIFLLFSFFTFRVLTNKRRATVVFQNLSEFGGRDRERYTELESIREDQGWGRSFTPWTSSKKKQNKFK